jgi:hypothetical protein
MDDIRQEILRLTEVMFNASPGAKFLEEFVTFVENTSGTTLELANTLAEMPIFKDAMYADSLSNNEFATQFIENNVGDLVSAENKASAVQLIQGVLDGGQSRGAVMAFSAEALGSINPEDANWGAAGQQFQNRVEVSSFYAIDLSGPASTLVILQQVTPTVTNEESTVIAAKAALEASVIGRAVDGYIKNATVFVDLDGDNIRDVNEVSTTTDDFGNFTFPPGVQGFGNLVLTGGTDISMNRPFEGVMTAPVGSTVINPLTSLIDRMTHNGIMKIDEAMAIVLRALDLD